MRQYQRLTTNTLQDGTYKPNRTSVDTVSSFSQQYSIDLQRGFPLLTTKDLSGFRWNSLIHEIIWYLSGEEHIRSLREETGIWDEWADENGELDTAYGRFWRKFPMPDNQLPGESWPDDSHRWRNDDGTFDQIRYVIDQLNENPSTRRLVVSAWHPANAAVSTLPPCHYTFVFNVQGDTLNCHLTQRSGDIALGIPFNIAAYSILTRIIAQETGFRPGEFSHNIVDAHIYCGTGDRGEWYGDNLDELQRRFTKITSQPELDTGAIEGLHEWIKTEAPPEAEGDENKDHIPGLLTQLTRSPRQRPTIDIADDATVDNLSFSDIQLSNYKPHDGLSFGVAE